jgi:hypothetical protein
MKIYYILILIFITSCGVKKNSIRKNSVYLLTTNSKKIWYPHFTGTNEIIGECWEFGLDSTFSYYNYNPQKKLLSLINWRGNDIEIGEGGVVKWTLSSDILIIDRVSYIVKKLSSDTLIVFDPYKGYGYETLLFTSTSCW